MSDSDFITPEPFKMPSDFTLDAAEADSVMEAYYREVFRKIEEALITCLEIIEDRVPSNLEVRTYLKCGIFPCGKREYRWKGRLIVRVTPPTWSGKFCGHTITGFPEGDQ